MATVPNFTGPVFLAEVSETERRVDKPDAGIVAFYPRADGLYFKTSAGDEYRITATLVAPPSYGVFNRKFNSKFA